MEEKKEIVVEEKKEIVVEEKRNLLENVKTFRKNADYKKIIKTFTIIMAVVVIVVMTFANIGPTDKFDFFLWLTSAMILLGIMVFGLLMGESTSEDRQTNNPALLFQRNLRKYNETRLAIRPIDIFFSQFYVFFKSIELKKKKVEFLISNGIDNPTLAEYIIKYITLDDLPLLTKQMVIKTDEKTGKEYKIRKLSKNEYQAVEKVIKEGIKLNAPQSNYFLSAFGGSNDESIIEQKNVLEKQIKINKTFNRAWKILFSLFISFAWAFLTVKDFADANTAQAWMNLLSRLFALCTSYVSGYLSGVVGVKLKAELLLNKSEVLLEFKSYSDKKIFIPKSYDEEADELYQKELESKLQPTSGENVTEVIAEEPIEYTNDIIDN